MLNIFSLDLNKNYKLRIDSFRIVDDEPVFVFSKNQNNVSGSYIKALLLQLLNEDCCCIDFTLYSYNGINSLNFSFNFSAYESHFQIFLFLETLLD